LYDPAAVPLLNGGIVGAIGNCQRTFHLNAQRTLQQLTVFGSYGSFRRIA
jgi:hypothetical protein